MFNINKYLRCNCEFHKRNKCVYLQLNEQNCLFVVSGSISFGRHSIFKIDNYISTFVPPIFCTVLSIAQSSGVPVPWPGGW